MRCTACRLGLLHRHCVDCSQEVPAGTQRCPACTEILRRGAWAGMGVLLLLILSWGVAVALFAE